MILSWLQLVLLLGFTYRAAVLIARDQFPFGPLRARLDRSFTGSLVDLVHCVWCLSLWLGAGALVLTLYWWPTWGYVEAVFTASGVAGFLGDRA